MSGFWSAFEDKKSSHKSIRELAQEHSSRYEPPTDHDVNSYRDYYGPFLGHEPQYADPNDYSHKYQPPPGDVVQFSTPLSPCMQSVMENLKLIEQHNARIEMKVLHDNPYRNASEIPFYSDPHVQPCPEYSYETRIPTIEDCSSIEQLNMILRMNLIHLQNVGREEFQDEMFVCPNEINCENSVSSPTHTTDIENEPNLEVVESTRDTMILNKALHSCCDDADDDTMLEEYVDSENFMEPLVSEILEFSSTIMNDVSSSNQSAYICDTDPDFGLMQLFCESEHDTQLVFYLRKDDSFVDTNVLMHHDIIVVSDSLPMSEYDVSSNLSMHENKSVDDVDDTESGIDELFFHGEHDTTVLVSGLGRMYNCQMHESKLDVCSSLAISQTGNLPPNLDLVCNKIVKPTFLRESNLGLELCASQILLDHFAAKYYVMKEPQLECESLHVPNNVHFELDLVHDAPLKWLDFVPKSISVEKSRFGGRSSCLTASLKLLPCFICVRLLKSLHVVFWVDPQLFRLYMYGEFCCI